MPTLTTRDKRLIRLAEKGGNDAALMLLDVVDELEDTIYDLKQKIDNRIKEIETDVTRPLQERIEVLRDNLASFKMPNLDTLLESIRGQDGRNPLTMSDNEPTNPQIGDLWYRP